MYTAVTVLTRRLVRELMPPSDWLGAATSLPPSVEPLPIPVLGVATIFHAGYLLRCIRSIDFLVETLVLIQNGEDPEVTAAVRQLTQ